jgi:hypothetical protein
VRTSKATLLALMALIVLSLPVRLAAAEFKASAKRLGDVIELAWTLSDQQSIKGNPQPKFPAMDGLTIISGPATGTSMRLVNGSGSYEKSWTWTVLPPARDLKLGPARLSYGNRQLASNPLSIKAGQSTTKLPEQTLMLELEASTRQPVVGEVFRLDLRLNFRENVRNFERGELVLPAGLLAEELKLEGNPQIETRDINGESWQSAVLASWLLTPLKLGSYEIPPVVAQLSVDKQRRRRDPFDSFFFDRYDTRTAATQPLKFSSRDLPPGAPDGYRGAIGQFRVKAEVDKQELEVGDALTYSLILSGEGNLSNLATPEIAYSHDLERYDTQEESSVSPGPRGYAGSRQFKTLFVPRAPGSQTIDAYTFSWFDPKKNQYFSRTVGPFAVTVSPGSGTQGSAGLTLDWTQTGSRVESYGEDIRFLAELKDNLPMREQALQRRPVFFLLLLIALLPVPAGFLLGLWRDRRDSHSGERNKRRNLEKARQELAAGGEITPARLEQVLRAWLAHRLALSESGLLLAEIPAVLRQQNVSQTKLDALLAFVSELEAARYAGAKTPEAGQLLELLADLDEALKGGRA